MEQRERILLIVLAGMVLAAGFYYGGTIGSYLPSFTGGSDDGGETRTDVQPGELVSKSVERYRNALRRSLGLDSLDFERIDASGGLSGTVRIELSLETDTPLPKNSLRGRFEGRLLTDGLPRGTARVTEPARHPLGDWTFRVRDRSLFVAVPDAFRMRFDDVALASGAPFSPGLSGITERSVLDRTERQWRDRPVHAIELEADTGSKFLYVSREEPHRLLGVTAGYDPGWTRRVEYDSDVIASLETYRDDTLVRDFERTGDRRSRLTLHAVDPEGSNAVRLTLTPSGNALDADLEVRRTQDGSYSEVAEASVSFENGRPSALEGEFRRESSGALPGLRLRLNSEGLELAGQGTSSPVDDPSSYESGTLPELLERVFSGADTATGESTAADDAEAPDSSDGTTDPEEVRAEPSDTTDDTRTKDRTTESRDRPTEVTYPENSGETVVRWTRDNFSRSEPPPQFHRAQELYRAGRIDRARKRLENLADTYPRSINVHFTLAMIHLDLDRAVRAREYFRTVVSLGHDSQLVGWSRAYLRQLDLPESPSNNLSRNRAEG